MSARIGIIGGTGLYSLFEQAQEREIVTPYGETSSPITLGRLGGVEVAFLTRHGRTHSVPPHKIPYRANVWALASLGVKALITSSAVGGLQQHAKPGAFVVPDQVVDRTWGREHTFFEDEVQHLVAPDPFDPQLRQLTVNALEEFGFDHVDGGNVVVIQGPRFSTRAESSEYAANPSNAIINMTLAPEVFLARELGLGVANLSFVTDSDSVVDRGHEDAVTPELVTQRLVQAQPKIKRVLASVVRHIPQDFEATPGVPAEATQRVLAQPVRTARW